MKPLSKLNVGMEWLLVFVILVIVLALACSVYLYTGTKEEEELLRLRNEEIRQVQQVDQYANVCKTKQQAQDERHALRREQIDNAREDGTLVTFDVVKVAYV